MVFDKTRWSSPWNSDLNCTQNSAWGKRGGGDGVGIGGLRDSGGLRGGWDRVQGMMGSKGRLGWGPGGDEGRGLGLVG